MRWDEKNIETFKALESAVIALWRREPQLTDRMVARAYEALYQRYDAEARGRRPRPHALSGLELSAEAAIREACEWRLGRGPVPASSTGTPAAVPIEEVRGCLRELVKSVERHRTAHATDGYLGFVAKYLPKAAP